MFPILIHIGPLTVHTYGFFVALGFLAAYFVGRLDFVRRDFSAPLWENLTLWLMLGGLVGARVFYFGLESPRVLLEEPFSFFKIWEGGLVYYGGFIGGFAALWIFCRRKELPVLGIMDLLVKPLALGQAFGRLGCFSAGCCYGKSTHSIFGVTFKNPESLAPLFISLHPTQIYESLGDVFIFSMLAVISRRNPRVGIMTGSYLVGYGFLRFIIEIFRNDFRGFLFLSLSPSQWGSILAILAGIILLLRRKEAKVHHV